MSRAAQARVVTVRRLATWVMAARAVAVWAVEALAETRAEGARAAGEGRTAGVAAPGRVAAGELGEAARRGGWECGARGDRWDAEEHVKSGRRHVSRAATE